jgi:hypothetical protein
MKKLLISFVLGVISSLAMTGFLIIYFKEHNTHIIKTLEPLLIAPELEFDDDRYYVLPTGTHLYIDEDMPEGHVLYHAYFYNKGKIKCDEVPMLPEYKGNHIVPVWLDDIDSGTLKAIFRQFPLSKRDMLAA